MKVFKSIDPVGNLIFLPRKNTLLRGIRQKYSKDMIMIVAKCIAAGLVGKNIIETKIATEKYHPDFELFLQHEIINPFTYPSEWSSDMFYDASNAVLDLLHELNLIKLTIKDCHLHNVAFHKGKFVWIDFGSFANNSNNGINFINGFRDNFINTVIYSSQINLRKMLNLFKEDQSFSKNDIMGHLSLKERCIYNYYEFKANVFFKLGLSSNVIHTLKAWLTHYKPKNPLSTPWANYQREQLGALNKQSTNDIKTRIIMDFIEKTHPKRILDVGGNAGLFCFLAEKLGTEGIVFDIDNGAVNLAYSYIKTNSIQNVTPLVMDFLYPTPPLSTAGACEDDGCISLTHLSAKKRLQSDLVLGLAIVHHLVFFQKVTFEEIVRQFASFTTQYLIVEFVHPHDIHVSKWDVQQFPWYNLENFLHALNNAFEILTTENCLQDHRTLIFCKLKRHLTLDR